jgi:hypothetical protein
MKNLRSVQVRVFFLINLTVSVMMFLACSDAGFSPDTGKVPVNIGSKIIDSLSVPEWTEPDKELRASVSLNGTWIFIPEGYAPREVKVPGFWEAIAVWPEYESFPEYLAGTADETLDMIEGNNWDKKTIHRGTYLRDIDILDPEAVTRISFESINHKADVYLNDQYIGSHRGPYLKATFDVSKAVVKGMNRLRVELTDGSAIMGRDGRSLWPSGYYSMTDITGLYRGVTMELLPAVYISDTFIVPSVKRNDLTIEHTLVNTLDTPASVWIMSRTIDNDASVSMQTAPYKVTIPAKSSTRAVIIKKWDNPVLWSPVDPHLYTLRTLIIDEAGAPLDMRNDRFGFREVWIEDGCFMLNGMRMNLIGENVDDQASRPRYWAMKYFSCDNARQTLKRIKDLNVNTIRFHQAPPEECIYDMADEMGILIISESPVFARLDITPPLHWNAQYLQNSINWINAYVKAQRNHPSIVMWSLENEMFLYIFDMSLNQINKLQYPAKDADTIKRPDGVSTSPRPVSWDGDSFYLRFMGYNPETVNWHYPCLYGPIFSIEPINEWYDDAISHFRPFLIKDVPCGVGETMVVRNRDWTKHTPDQTKAMQGMAVRAMRILGFSDMRPYKMNWAWHFFDPEGKEHPWAPYYHSLYTQEQKDALVKNIRESYHPIAVFDYEYTRTKSNPDGSFGPVVLTSSKSVERKLIIMNDSFMPGVPQKVTWSVTDETSGQLLAGDAFEITVKHGFNATRTIRFNTPNATYPHNLVLNLKSQMQGLPQGDYSAQYRFTVNPKTE